MKQGLSIAILDSVPESYWADDGGITDAQKFIDLLRPFMAAKAIVLVVTFSHCWNASSMSRTKPPRIDSKCNSSKRKSANFCYRN